MDVISYAEFFRFIAAFVFVMALMGGLALLMKRINEKQLTGGKSTKRLKIKEILHLDTKRKLAIIQRDNIEHLIILSPQSETVIETGIESAHNIDPDDKKDDHES